MNVVPNQLTIGFDMRITPTTDIVEFENRIRKWTEEVKFRLPELRPEPCAPTF